MKWDTYDLRNRQTSQHVDALWLAERGAVSPKAGTLLERIAGGTGDPKVSNRDGDGDVNSSPPCFLVVVLKACFPAFASESSSSYGWVAFPSQSLDSVTLFTDFFSFQRLAG